MIKGRYISLFLQAFLFAFVACARIEQENDSISSSKTQRITAWMEGQGETKTSLSQVIDGMYYPLWEEQDTIGVFSEESQRSVPFFLYSGAGSVKGFFEGPLATGKITCLFPYEESAECISNKLYFTLPTEQWYRAENIGFKCFPMLAVSDNQEVHFKNMCSILRLPIKGSGFIKSIKIKTQNKVLGGRAYVDLSDLDNPTVHLLEDNKTEITLYCSAFLNSTYSKMFHIVIPSQTYDDLTIEIEAEGETITKAIQHEFVMPRSQLRSVSPFVIEAQSIDLDHIPYTQIWYKTSNNTKWNLSEDTKFDVPVLSNVYEEELGYGIIVFKDTVRVVNRGPLYSEDNWGNNLQGLYLPDGVETIEDGALPYELSELRVPARIREIGLNNLHRVTKLLGCHIAEDGRSIVKDGNLLKAALYGIDEYTTPPGVKNVLYGSLRNIPCRVVKFSEGVRQIEGGACLGEQLEEIHFAESIRTLSATITTNFIGLDRYYGNPSIFKGYFGSTHLVSEDHLCLIDPNTEDGAIVKDIVPGKDYTSYTFPEGINGIKAVFDGWNDLEEVNLPRSLTSINPLILSQSPHVVLKGDQMTPDGLFFLSGYEFTPIYKEGVKEYIIPEGFRCIPMETFQGFGMESVTVPEGIMEVGQYCFASCRNLKTVQFPSTITRISKDTFMGCEESLENVYLPVRTPPELTGVDAVGMFTKLHIYVPEESLNDYLNHPFWSIFQPYLQGYHFDIPEDSGQYHSSDYSIDGMVTVLQEATEGAGIDLVLAGECYTDRQIKDGTYLKEMEEVADAFFDVEPYRSFRHLFNIYAVNAVSQTDSLNSLTTSAFGLCINAANASITINPEQCLPYLYKVLPPERVNQSLLMIRVNTRIYPNVRAGTCQMGILESTPKCDYGSGVSLAAFTGNIKKLKAVVQHEAGGHGFGKLADEYTSRSEDDNPPTEGEIASYNERYENYGWWKNVDFTSNPSEVKWSHFLMDSRYESELLGVYEGGAAYYKYGVYRPSEFSIMDDNLCGYNAPSREAIYYRIHKLAYGENWEYNYEDFVQYDKGKMNIRPTSYRLPSRPGSSREYEVRPPLPVPKSIDHNWIFTVCE